MRLRVGTDAQLKAALRLRLAVSTIQVHWRRCRNARLRRLHHEYTQQRARRLLEQQQSPPLPPATLQPPPSAPTAAKTEGGGGPSEAAPTLAPLAVATPLVELERPSALWSLALRVVRIDQLRLPSPPASSDRLYCYFSLFGDGGVATPVHGETRCVTICDSSSITVDDADGAASAVAPGASGGGAGSVNAAGAAGRSHAVSLVAALA